ncbi:hypothetical protein ABZ896_06405 [Streptomyces sp. NPDC047072]|uniref:hypothetical protein n=1 Tax=Streptomyces sp. NPDC047072 TaxID=3154809 RepID=UPI0033DD700A
MPLLVRRRALVPRRALAVLLAGVGLAALSGCTVPVDAVAGISVTEDGELLGVMMVCGHHIDGATLYKDADDPDRQEDVGSWTAGPQLGEGLTTWSLTDPGTGWTADQPLGRLTAGSTYVLYGWTDDNSSSSTSVSFTPADRDRLTPGMVRYETDTEVTVPIEKFKAKACEDS